MDGVAGIRTLTQQAFETTRESPDTTTSMSSMTWCTLDGLKFSTRREFIFGSRGPEFLWSGCSWPKSIKVLDRASLSSTPNL